MEVSRRRTLQKHLEPARPLRRCLHVVIGKQSAPVITDLKWWIKDVSLKLINYIINCSPMKNLSLCPEPNVNAPTCAQAVMEEVHQEVRNTKTVLCFTVLFPL